MRDFSFLFYPGDVLRDVQFFSKAQKGCYLEALTAHLENPRFSEKTLRKITAGLTNTERAEFFGIFTKDDDGFYLAWADTAIEKRSAYLQSRLRNRESKTKKEKKLTVVRAAQPKRETVAAPAQQPISKTHVFDMENENKNENKNGNANGTERKTKTEKAATENRKTEPAQPSQPKAESPVRAKMRTQFLESYERRKRISFAWDNRHDLHLDDVIGKIRAVTKSTDDATVLQFWDTLVNNLPDWYFTNAFSPSTINTRFNEIVAKIHQPAATGYRIEDDPAFREMIAAGNPYVRT